MPWAVRPSLIRRVWTPMTGMDRYTGRATLAILTRLAGRSRFTTAIDGLANGHHRLLKLFERRLHTLEIVGIKRAFDR